MLKQKIWRYFGVKMPKVAKIESKVAQKNLKTAIRSSVKLRNQNKKLKEFDTYLEGIEEYLEENSWKLDTSTVLEGTFTLRKEIGESSVTIFSKTQELDKEKISLETQKVYEYLSSFEGPHQDYTTAKLMDYSNTLKNADYEMNSEFLIVIKNEEKDSNNSGLYFQGFSNHGEIILKNVFRIENFRGDFNDLDLFGEVVERYPGAEVSALEPNFSICLYEYLRIFGVDELLVMAIEGLSVGLEEKKGDLLVERLEKLFDN